MPQEGEASVEEILESIKKVIARDNRASTMDLRRRRERDSERDSTPEPADEDEAIEVLDLGTMEFAEDTGGISGDYDDDLAEEDFADEDEDLDGPLTTEAVRSSMRDNFAALAMLAEPGAPPQIVRSGETSLEGLVRDMLRPMLAEWLDAKLPGMVEKMVQAEIARIAGKRR